MVTFTVFRYRSRRKLHRLLPHKSHLTLAPVLLLFLSLALHQLKWRRLVQMKFHCLYHLEAAHQTRLQSNREISNKQWLLWVSLLLQLQMLLLIHLNQLLLFLPQLHHNQQQWLQHTPSQLPSLLTFLPQPRLLSRPHLAQCPSLLTYAVLLLLTTLLVNYLLVAYPWAHPQSV